MVSRYIAIIISNSETFDALDKEVIKSLEYFQTYLLRGLIALPKSCPIPVLTYESNLLQMKYRLYKRVLNFAKHIYCQSEDLSLAKQIMSEQIKNGWPGLCKQAPLISNELNIEGLFDHDVDKVQFKSLVQKACQSQNKAELKSQISSYKKMSALRDEIVKGNGYFYSETLQNARVLFRFRVELIEAKMNFKQKYQKEGFCVIPVSQKLMKMAIFYIAQATNHFKITKMLIMILIWQNI